VHGVWMHHLFVHWGLTHSLLDHTSEGRSRHCPVDDHSNRSKRDVWTVTLTSPITTTRLSSLPPLAVPVPDVAATSGPALRATITERMHTAMTCTSTRGARDRGGGLQVCHAAFSVTPASACTHPFAISSAKPPADITYEFAPCTSPPTAQKKTLLSWAPPTAQDTRFRHSCRWWPSCRPLAKTVPSTAKNSTF
jgi:hypothetical protein